MSALSPDDDDDVVLSDYFALGSILNRDGPHGTLILATPLRPSGRFGADPLTVKILPLPSTTAPSLRSIISLIPHHPLLNPYLAVLSSPTTTNLVTPYLPYGDISKLPLPPSPASEAILAQILQKTLSALTILHASSTPHGALRPSNILLTPTGITLTDYALAPVLSTLRSRVSYPGAPLWPAPDHPSPSADIWALAITILELLDGRPAVLRSRSPTPALKDPSLWSQDLTAFISSASLPAASRPTAVDLLNSPFISRASPAALAAALPTPRPPTGPAYDETDVVLSLFRRNHCVRAPLIDLDDLEADDFVNADHAQDQDGGGRGEERPALEAALKTAVRNRRRAGAVGLGGKDEADRRRTARTDERIGCVVEMAEMFRKRRGK